ncbi:MAG: type IX secretion system membrane protein PorP/SprF [Bacteroidales bacterium]|nr:type IX secretion system membrane protein PorP/SprF [Bacteroidales bacterium]
MKNIHKSFGKYALFGCLMAFSFQSFSQQNCQLSQYSFNTIAVNPAYTGYKEAWYLQAAHRLQWTSMDGAPVTSQISIDGVTNSVTKNVGLGLQLTSDRLGAQSATSLYANYAYRLQLDYSDRSRLAFGLGVGVTQYGTDMSILRATNPDEPILQEGIKNTFLPDVRFGIYYYNPSIYIGVSVLNLLTAKTSSKIFNAGIDSTSNVMQTRSFYLISGGLFDLSDNTKFRPSIMIREDLKGPTDLDLGTYFIFGNSFWVGGSYRTNAQFWIKEYAKGYRLNKLNAIIGVVQFQATDRLRIGYSYDLSLNSLGSTQGGSHELTLGWTFPVKSKRILSPRFF